ncbi:MAG: Coq4 family protein [Novosphingobium sp.]
MPVSQAAFSTAASDREAMPFLLPGRPPFRWDLPKAWRHFRLLIKNKEDTTQVFPIFEALPWTGVYEAARQFCESEAGKATFLAEPWLPGLLDDHAALRRMPEGSLAHAYCEFMEGEGLTAQGLVDEFDKFMGDAPRIEDRFAWYFDRMRDTHDLMHVLTGYGRDALGEQCVLAFTYSQQPSLGHLFLGYAGGLEIKKRIRSKAPVLRAVREGQRLGKACPRLIEQPIRELLPLPLEEVRQRLNVAAPRLYQEAHRVWRSMGLDPYALIAPDSAAA